MPKRSAAAQILDLPESTMLEMVDVLLVKGVLVTGDVTIGVSGVDLIYLRLSALLSAVLRVARRDRPSFPALGALKARPPERATPTPPRRRSRRNRKRRR
jgi:hypothetical protein